MCKLGLIGQNIDASRSPALHRMLGDLCTLPVSYELQIPTDGSPEAFSHKLDEMLAAGFNGTNVTFPYKQIAIARAEEVNDAVKKIGASNTLRIKNGKIFAYNTDYTGFIRGYRSRIGSSPAGKVLLIGAGGVGRAIGFALFELGATELMVSDLNAAGAQSLVDAINVYGFKARYIAPEDIGDAAKQADGLINCTPVGHYTTPGTPLSPEYFGGQSWAFDAVYTPIDTEFLIAANQANLKIVSGFDLFFYQALDAFEIFTDQSVQDVEPVWNRFREQYEVTSSLI
ncbi:shikimate dehydrogenase [Marinomonas piezotolerans]|uniref:Shikimate dehydrogenase n=1 Tax=Marinomonas piezotolerans TaxID=2213058 RepID=A0A370UDU9_9GAMM|nr:shikimate dehydrogenase [Marinomonas piezotolerans]RDL45968.1 shikimate dehydrogenase [Marinomonas piezotolerans]